MTDKSLDELVGIVAGTLAWVQIPPPMSSADYRAEADEALAELVARCKAAEAERDEVLARWESTETFDRLEAAEARVVLLEAVVNAASRVVVCEQVEQFSEAQNDEIRGRANDLRKAFEALYLGSRGSGA